MGAPPGVTSRRVHTWQVRSGPAVRDPRTCQGGDGAAARAGSDVGRRDQVAVPALPAVRAGEDPPGRLGYPPGAPGTRRGGAPLVHEREGDPGGLRLVRQGADQVPDPPGADPLVVPPPGVQAEDAARVADGQRADLACHGPADDGPGRFVLGLPHPPPVPGLGSPLEAPVLPPPPRPPLPRLRRPPRHGAAAGPGITQVLAALRADRPPRHQQQLPVRSGGGIRVDDPQVHPGHPARIRGLAVRIRCDRDLRGHLCPEPARLAQHGHRADLGRRVGRVPVQPHQQRRAAPRHRQPQPPPVQRERARIPAHRHQAPAAPREPRCLITGRTALGGGEPGVRIPAQHRPGPRAVQLPERARARARQLPAQLPISGQRRVLAAAPPGVQLQHAAPHVPGRPQQPEQAPPLPGGGAQPAPRGAVHHARRSRGTFSGHTASKAPPTDKPR